MKLLILLPLVLYTGACSPEEARAAARESVAQAKALVADFQAASGEKLAEARIAIDELKQKAAQAAEEHKPELEQLGRDLERKRQELVARLADLKDAGVEKLDQARRDLEPRIAELKEQARAALEKLKP